MKKIWNTAEKFVENCKISDIALIKTCVFSFGLAAGSQICKDKKKPVFWGSLIVGVLTWVILMTKFISLAMSKDKQENEEDETVFFTDYMFE